MRLLLASNNVGKLGELEQLLADLPIDLVRPVDIGLNLNVDETCSTYRANARRKARAFARESGLLVLADDWGLEVAALGNWPGVRSARVAGPEAGDLDRRAMVLARLAAFPGVNRSARFVCAMVLAEGNWLVAEAEGILEGTIGEAPRGDHGFGYDPIFVPKGANQTLAELSSEQKNALSHRARAVRILVPVLRTLTSTER